MSKTLLIFKREYLTRVKRKSFIISTILVPVGILLLMSIQILIISFGGQAKLRIAVKDDSGRFAYSIQDSRDGSLYFFYPMLSFDSLKNNYHSPELGFDGLLHIPAQIDIKNPNGIVYYSDKLLGMSAKSYIQRELEDKIRKTRLSELGVTTDMFQQAQNVTINISEKGSNEDLGSTSIATIIGFVMGFMMYMVILLYGMMVMRGVAEEKTNRIVEVMLSSVRPFQMMLGKILGIGAVGLTQFGIWIVFLLFINIGLSLAVGAAGLQMPTTGGGAGKWSQMGGQMQNQPDTEEIIALAEQFKANIDRLPLGEIVFAFLFYFLFGYLLYAALYAAVGSAINDEGEAQSLSFPVSLPVILSIFVLSAGLENPNSSLVWWASMIPLSSPILMPFRVAFGVPWYELCLSMLLLVAGVWLAVWLAAKIYRTGILMYGKKVTFAEIGRWIFK